MRSLLLSTLAACACAATSAQEAPQTDGDKYKVVFENDCVRVFEYRDRPGERTHQHTHPNAFVVYAIAPFKRTITLPDGKVIQRQFNAGDAMWSESQTHIGTNVGDTPTHAVLVEIKKASGCGPR
jgi:beta-alanine degradation protein BauB